jgi:hypothetical protein
MLYNLQLVHVLFPQLTIELSVEQTSFGWLTRLISTGWEGFHSVDLCPMTLAITSKSIGGCILQQNFTTAFYTMVCNDASAPL